ncbi:MAG: entericidin A/B family lipoprotein [Neisseria sp.]|nr:entericidin A/B family lipoprotein [Neisseria sp.]
MKKLILMACTAVVLLAGCNTVAGVGQDIQAGGSAIERAAQ